MIKDVVCGMMVDEATAQSKSDYKGETYYFCAPGCKRSFDAEPGKYAVDSSKGMDDHNMDEHSHI